MLRLVAGIAAVSWYRTRSQILEDRELHELVDVLSAELTCRLPIELRESRKLTTAATVGWRRPTVLLPAEWRTWTPAELRTVLAHEIAHIRHADFLSCLGSHLALALHFYHPLVHWLSRRLRLELELAADAAADAVSGGAEAYVQTLARLALRQADRPLGWPARTFLPTQGTLLRRIEMLRGPHPFPKSVSLPGRLATVGLLLLVGLVAAGFRGVTAGEPAAVLQPPALVQPGQAQKKPEGTPATPTTVEFVPADAAAVVVIRVGDIVSHPVFEPVRTKFQAEFEKNGILVDQIDQITLVLLPGQLGAPARPGLFGGPGQPVEPPVAIIRTKTPEAAEKLAQSIGKSEVRTDGPVEYVVGQSGIAWKLASPRLLIVAQSERALQLVVAAGQKSRSRLVSGDRWKELQQEHVVLAISSDVIRNIRRSIPPNSPELLVSAPYAPLWEDSAEIRLGLSLNKELTVKGTIYSIDAESAGRVQETAQALLVLMKNTARSLRDSDPARIPPEAQSLVGPLFEPLESLLANSQLKTDGQTVRLTAQAAIKPDLLSPVIEATGAARKAAQRVQSMNNLKQIALALHNYADVHKGQFPPAVVIGEDGKTPHSWRVAILPYLEQAPLYESYKFDEPWDSANNKKVLDQMPEIYRDPAGKDEKKGVPSYFMLTGKAALGRADSQGAKFIEIPDGTANTLMVVEAKRDIPWTKPDDIPFDAEKDPPKLGSRHTGGFLAALADGSAKFFSDKLPPETLKALITISGGEEVKLP